MRSAQSGNVLSTWNISCSRIEERAKWSLTESHNFGVFQSLAFAASSVSKKVYPDRADSAFAVLAVRNSGQIFMTVGILGSLRPGTPSVSAIATTLPFERSHGSPDVK